MLRSAASEFEPYSHPLENQRHNPVAWLAARANVATATARVFAEINGFAGCRS